MTNSARFTQIAMCLTILVCTALGSCDSSPSASIDLDSSGNVEASEVAKKSRRANVNLSIFIDLSDRLLDPLSGSSISTMDLACAQAAANSFVSHVGNKRINFVDDAIQTIILPVPNDTKIQSALNKMKQGYDKDYIYEDLIQLSTTYSTDLGEVYDQAQIAKEFPGSNLYGFLKDKAERYCIANNKENLLLILTDGFMYHADTKEKNGNRLNYLTPATIKQQGLANSNWREVAKEKDCGFILPNKHLHSEVNLGDLEVLVVGINSGTQNPGHSVDLIKAWWIELLQDLGVQTYDFVEADLPTYLETEVEDFVLGIE